MSSQTPRIVFPFEAKKSRRSALLLSLILSVALAILVMWALVYGAMLQGVSEPPDTAEIVTNFSHSIYGSGIDLLKKPAGIAIDERSGNLFVSDSSVGQILIFDSSGALIEKFGKDGAADFELRRPTSIALSNSGRVYVVDAALEKLVIFDGKHKPERAVYFDKEAPIAVSLSQDFYGDERLWVTSKSGLSWGDVTGNVTHGYYSWGTGDVQFDSPTTVLVKSDESTTTVFVCDSLNYRVQAMRSLDTSPVAIWIYGSPLPEKDAFRYKGTDRKFGLPVSMTFGRDNQLLVLDGMNAEVVALDLATGIEVDHFGSVGSDDGQIRYPSNIAYGNGLVWIADQGNARISSFTQAESILPPRRLDTRKFPIAILWSIVAVLGICLSTTVLWLLAIRPTPLVMTAEAFEKLLDQSVSEDFAFVCESVIVPLGAEAVAQAVTPDLKLSVKEVPLRMTPELAKVRKSFERLDFDAILVASDSHERVLVSDSLDILQLADTHEIRAIDIENLLAEIELILLNNSNPENEE